MSDTTSVGKPARNEWLTLALAIAVGLALAALPFFHYTRGQRHHREEEGVEHMEGAHDEDAAEYVDDKHQEQDGLAHEQ